jgi:hypothetical protein
MISYREGLFDLMIEQQCTVRHRHTIIYCLLPTLLNGLYHNDLLLLYVTIS